MNELMLKIISSIIKPEFTGVLYYIRLTFFIVSGILIFATFLLLKKTVWFRLRFWEDIKEFFTVSPVKGGKFSRKWKDIIRKINSGIEGEQKMAIILADNMLDEALEKLGFKGETVAERLGEIDSKKLKNINEVWEAHKIRNNIVHDADYKLTVEEAKRTIEIYDEVFQNLGIF